MQTHLLNNYQINFNLKQNEKSNSKIKSAAYGDE